MLRGSRGKVALAIVAVSAFAVVFVSAGSESLGSVGAPSPTRLSFSSSAEGRRYNLSSDSSSEHENLPPAPPTEVKAFDTPNDAGGSITVTWTLSGDDGGGEEDVRGYNIIRSTVSGSGYETVGSVLPGDTSFTDGDTEDGVAYYYVVEAKDAEFTSPSEETPPTISSAQWFNRQRLNMLMSAILLSAFVLYFIRRAKMGEKLFIRKLAGLEAVDEGIGRATEMGRPVLYVPGITDMDDIQTIASMVILGRVAKRVAQYDTPLVVPSKMPIAYTMAQEVVKQAYTEAGRPDAYNPDNIPFLTMDQFGYAAAVDGIMLRDKPGTIFYLGAFYAESLILAETGHSVGAIQIAGTAMPAQLPFFITACDYTLIGEELFAASAYLSGEPLLLGSLKGQDWGKALCMLLIGVGVILEIAGIHWLTNWLQTF